MSDAKTDSKPPKLPAPAPTPVTKPGLLGGAPGTPIKKGEGTLGGFPMPRTAGTGI